MSRNPKLAAVTDASQRRPPVRVRSRRITTESAQLYPPDGQEKIWWDRLKKALGTTSSDFVTASLHHLQAATQFPGSGICKVGINAALAFIEGFAPRNEVEAAQAVQMACTHSATMSVLGRLGPAGGTEDRVCRFAAAAARLLRAYTMQLEAYRRLRHGGDQYVRVEHVHISEGAQAVIGNVRASERGPAQPPETRGPTDARSSRRACSVSVKKHKRRNRHSYSVEVADLICERMVVDGLALREICRDAGMPGRSTLFLWLRQRRDFREKYIFAKQIQIQWLADDMIDIADGRANDWMEREEPEGNKVRVCDNEDFRRRKKQIGALQWRISKLKPKRYYW